MTALAAARSIPRYGAGSVPNQLPLPQKGSTTIYHGGLVVLNAGYAAPGAAGVGLIAAGVAKIDGSSDRSINSGADGAKKVVVDQGVFPFANSADADAITQAHAGRDCYIVDDQTVALTDGGGTRSRAGTIMWVDSDGVWVQVGTSWAAKLGSGGNVAPALTAFSGGATAPAAIQDGGIYDVPTTSANSTITLPAAAPSGTRATFVADGTKNGHTVQYIDATGTVAITTALTASKRHQVIVTKLGAVWHANAYVSP